MRQIVIVLSLLSGCDALKPAWDEPMQLSVVNPFPGATCDDVCELRDHLCLEESCGGATVVVLDDAFTPVEALPLACDEPLLDYFGEPTIVSCCCGSN